MSHIIRKKKKLLARIRRIRGQVDAVEKALENDSEEAETMQLIASIRGAINGLMGELIEDHIQVHLIEPIENPDPQWLDETKQLVSILRTYLK